ncbi:MAG: AAA family ATPase [Deltaproteobacteria bacterium]|nr:AAA family ATPase [Deltaproteobacteria bacterium]
MPGARPAGWRLTPKACAVFAHGGMVGDTPITRKFWGDDALVERAVASLASDRGLLLIGEPGTAKSWLSELLAAAISGVSTLVVHGTAGLTEDQIKYGWNYALLLAEGPGPRALVPGPLYTGMRTGTIVRFEEITRAPHEVSDGLLAALSEKLISIPELEGENGLLLAKPGFNLIATANTRDRGVNEMSAALKRRFNFEHVLPVADLDEEIRLVREQVTAWVAGGPAAGVAMGDDVIELLVTTFHEIRAGTTAEGVRLERAAATMSTAEAVSVGYNAALYASFFGASTVEPRDLVQWLGGTVVKDDPASAKALRTYWEVAVKPRASAERGAWRAYWAARDLLEPRAGAGERAGGSKKGG